ncbi:TIGR03618 family F420-dependent PPOX class oxidoreductase [Spongiactinospora sp. TRM90649]|uniref:TIGR03618 family F420-dependent PPOX class oxidoreductase n=1 Tax=Spongiactinospora sp. TRM90649 TaxID=3031114 RepID=UPI0023F9FE35|nr:TIGR03618 family F420-dependent PPOX class oxidoreductase [Spongiactinospora sp. TRM90649]MDF5751881.1 TIGR03618 family F420-dependent PPOX class oxidoreductase [Spongiactinospora sp. TRM90649]
MLIDHMTQAYEPGRGPGPATPSEEDLIRLLGEQRMGALATNGKDGRPVMSTVAYAWDPAERIIRISSIEGRVKVRRLAADPRCALYVSTTDFMAYAVAAGEAEVSPPSAEPGDETGRELLGMQAPFERPEDEAVFLRNMVEDRRVVIRIRVARLYGGGIALP